MRTYFDAYDLITLSENVNLDSNYFKEAMKDSYFLMKNEDEVKRTLEGLGIPLIR